MSDAPPVWADTWLRLLLPARDRDTVSGDVMEEYRKRVRPTRSRLAADAWYIGQVSRFAWRPAAWGVFLAAIFVSRTAFDWFAAVRTFTDFAPRAEMTTLTMASTLLVIGASSALRSQSLGAGIVATASALVVSALLCPIAATIMYVGWQSPALTNAISASGGLSEVYLLPIMLVVPGTIVGAIGASIARLARPPKRSTD